VNDVLLEIQVYRGKWRCSPLSAALSAPVYPCTLVIAIAIIAIALSWIGDR